MKASPEQVFALAARFATKVNFLKIESNRAQLAIDNADDPLWGVVESSLVDSGKSVGCRNLPYIEVLSELPKPCAQRSDGDQIADQERFYRNLGWSFSRSDLVVPVRRKQGFNRLLVMANTSLTNNSMYGILRRSFPCRRYRNNLDAVIPKESDERHSSNGPYAIWVQDCVEADEVNRNKSANMVKEEGLKTLTLLERMYFEALVYYETRKHLDWDSTTLCSGSRDLSGNVPCAEWDHKFQISKAFVGEGYPILRARQVITI